MQGYTAIAVGTTVGKWTVIAAVDAGGRKQWLCRCDCGKERAVQDRYLRKGRSLSCGCRIFAEFARRATKHGHNRETGASPTYRSWYAMLTRCTNPNAAMFKFYGARGVTVCAHWRRFENFLADMGERPSGKTLDRINPFGNYEPGNCRWATAKEQAQNTRRSAKESA